MPDLEPVAPLVNLIRPRGALLYGDEILTIPDPCPLVAGVLDLDSTALLYGESGSGKSFVALDWALCVASGLSWQDHVVMQGMVLYVVGEGLSGTQQRYASWKANNHIASVPALAFADHAPSILEPRGMETLKAWVSETAPRLVVLDTVARHIPGRDENAFETMSRVVEALDWIRVETGGCALAIHHTGKDTRLGARGHSSLKGAMDTEILCIKTTNTGRAVKLKVTKQKNHTDGHTLGTFKLKPVGDSLVLEISATRRDRNEDVVWQALTPIQPATYADWRREAIAAGIALGSFDRIKVRLLAKSMVVREPTDGDELFTCFGE